MSLEQIVDMILSGLDNQQREYQLQQKNPFVSDNMRLQYSQMEYAIRTAKFTIKEKLGVC